MNHLDLFSGIGGFAYAAQQVWGDEHEIVAFCEMDKFCQKVLKKHWPETEIINDVREITANANFSGRLHKQSKKQSTKSLNGIDSRTFEPLVFGPK